MWFACLFGPTWEVDRGLLEVDEWRLRLCGWCGYGSGGDGLWWREDGKGRASVIGTVVSVEFHLQLDDVLFLLLGAFFTVDGSLLKHAG